MGGTTGQEQEHDQVWRSLADGLWRADGPAAELRFGKRRWLGQRSRLIRRGCVRAPRGSFGVQPEAPVVSVGQQLRLKRPAVLAESLLHQAREGTKAIELGATPARVLAYFGTGDPFGGPSGAKLECAPDTHVVNADANVLNSSMDSGMAG
jgi:hypothetical protein